MSVYIGKSTIPGRHGLFAQKWFQKGCKIVEFSKNVAIYVQDCIKFSSKPRNLNKLLYQKVPFYEKWYGAYLNSVIKIDPESHQVYLEALVMISPHEEIFIHKGFDYWLDLEMSIGFIKEPGVLPNIYCTPAFSLYVREFYPTAIDIDVIFDIDKSEISPTPRFINITLIDKSIIQIPWRTLYFFIKTQYL